MADESEDTPVSADTKEQDASQASARQREERVKALREKQNEERMRKLEELKLQAEATQKFREQQEEERRKRTEAQKAKDAQRRTLVEERKKALLDADRERKEAMMRRYQDKESRLDAKRRNERGSMAFAFGSSTPRVLEPVDSSAYWSSRRSTSSVNVMSSWTLSGSPLTDFTDNHGDSFSSAKRAASVYALDQNTEGHKGHERMSSSMYGIFHWDNRSPTFHGEKPCGENLMTRSSLAVLDGRRRKTDLIPTIPIQRDVAQRPGSSRPASARGSVSQRGNEFQGRSMWRSMSHLGTTFQRRSRHLKTSTDSAESPQEKSATSLSTNDLSAYGQTQQHQQPRMTRAERLRLRARQAGQKKRETQGEEKSGLKSGELTPSSPTRPLSSMSQQSSSSTPVTPGTFHVRARTAPASASARKPRPISIAGSVAVSEELKSIKSPAKETEAVAKRTTPRATRPTASPAAVAKEQKTKVPPSKTPTTGKSAAAKVNNSANEPAVAALETPEEPANSREAPEETANHVEAPEEAANHVVAPEKATNSAEASKETANNVEAPEEAANQAFSEEKAANIKEQAVETANQALPEEKPASGKEQVVPQKKIIASEEEAKAALAEKRRLAREQMEREAEAERLRVEAERRAEEERREQEEQERKLAEEEMERLAREAKLAEEERLKKAIEEAERREEEERLRQEEESRLRAEKELAEQRAREEAERLRRETEERLRREEEERQERRKRVEAIMSRTRGAKTKGVADENARNAASNPATDAATTQQQPDLLEDLVSKTEPDPANGFCATDAATLPDVSLVNNADSVNSNTETAVD